MKFIISVIIILRRNSFPAKTRFTLIVPMAAITYSIQIFTEVSQIIYENFQSIVASK